MKIQAVYCGGAAVSRIYFGGGIVWQARAAIPVYAAGRAAGRSYASVSPKENSAVHAGGFADAALYGTASPALCEVVTRLLRGEGGSRGNASPKTETVTQALLCALCGDGCGTASGIPYETIESRMHAESESMGAAGGRTYGIVYAGGTGRGSEMASVANGRNVPAVHAGIVSCRETDAGRASSVTAAVADIRLHSMAQGGGGVASSAARETACVRLSGAGGMFSLAGGDVRAAYGYFYPILLRIADGDSGYPVSLLLDTGEEYPLENVSEPAVSGDEYIFTIT